MNRLAENLQWYWQVVLIHSGPTAGVYPVKMNAAYKSILIFQKNPRLPQENFVSDLINGGGREKNLHEWQQESGELRDLLERFTKEEDLILDPFGGSGTTAMIPLIIKAHHCQRGFGDHRQ